MLKGFARRSDILKRKQEAYDATALDRFEANLRMDIAKFKREQATQKEQRQRWIDKILSK